mmetsp:Transcript_12672/g.27371  ORF Transcript_12672/g.27371 Transcript_12672/m.27371 type:complete len:101 (-) Transcript_12672:89-391(-)
MGPEAVPILHSMVPWIQGDTQHQGLLQVTQGWDSSERIWRKQGCVRMKSTHMHKNDKEDIAVSCEKLKKYHAALMKCKLKKTIKKSGKKQEKKRKFQFDC